MVGYLDFPTEDGHGFNDFGVVSVAGELAREEALHASLCGGVDDGFGGLFLLGRDEADGGVLAVESCKKVLLGIVVSDLVDLDVGWEGRLGTLAGENGHREMRVIVNRSDNVRAKTSSCL